MNPLRLFRPLTLFLALASGSPASAGAPAEVVVLANTNIAASVDLARYYLERRGIPEAHLCLLNLPDGEVISREAYEERLRDPLLEFLRERGLIRQTRRAAEEVAPHETAWKTEQASIRYIVSVFGVPLRISDTRFTVGAKLADRLQRPEYKNSAAVDSELALLLHPGYPIGGLQHNPLFGLLLPSQLTDPPYPILMAARLDGPNPDAVRYMIDSALDAERYGLQGRCYFDSRSLQDEYFVGDYWIREACERFRREGYECALDLDEAMWGEDYPMQDTAVYLGWYAEHMSGPFTRSDFRFRSGAVAYHIHSSSAASLRSATRNWAGPLLGKGAAATMGAVSEPYLAFTPRLDRFSDLLCSGLPFADSVHLALSHLSWQVTVVGDPLYTPFRAPLEEQLRRLEADRRPELEWACVRRINILIREERFNIALEYCRQWMEKLDSLVLREKLADLYGVNELYQDAGKQYEIILERTDNAATACRVGARWLRILRHLKQDGQANRIEAQLRARWPDSPMLAWLDRAKR